MYKNKLIIIILIKIVRIRVKNIRIKDRQNKLNYKQGTMQLIII